MNNNTTNDLIKWAIFGLLGLALIAPFVVADSLYFPFIGGKAFFFRIVVEIAFALWLILSLFDRSYLPRSNWMIGLATLFTISTLVSALIGENPLKSIWSNYERMEGWMTVVHLWAYLVVLVSVVRTRREWHWLMNVSIVVATLIILESLGQWIGVNSWVGEHFKGLAESFSKAYPVHQSAERLDARLGNSIYLAVYMIIHVFMAGYLFYNAEDKTIKGGRVLGVFYSVFSLLCLFVIFNTLTRGAILGTLAGLIVAATVVAVKGTGRVRIAGVTGLVIVFLAGAIFMLNRDSQFVKSNPSLNRLATISWSDTKTQARSVIWPMAVAGSMERPIFGWGQENFSYIFNERYSPVMHGHEKWFDRAHSVYLDWLVAGGILGLGLYLGLYILSLYYIYKSDLDIAKKAALYGLVTAYAGHNFFAFDNVSSYILFFFVLGFLTHLRVTSSGYKEGKIGGAILGYYRNLEIHPDVIKYLKVPAIAILGIAGVYALNIVPIRENQALVSATRACGRNTPSAELYNTAIDRDGSLGAGFLSTGMGIQEAREQAIMCATRVLLADGVSADAKKQFLTLAEKAIADQIDESPDDARIYFFAGGMYNRMGEWDKALSYTKKGHELSPGKQQFAFEYGQSLLNSTDKSKDPLTGMTNVEKGLAIIKKAYDDAPEYFDAQANYASTLIFVKNIKEFDRLFATSTQVQRDPRVINALVGTGEYDRVIKTYRDMLVETPDNYQIHFSIGAVYVKAGRTWEAIAELRKVSAKDPSLKDQVEQAVKAIQEGTIKI